MKQKLRLGLAIVLVILTFGTNLLTYAQDPKGLVLVAETPVFGLGETGTWDDGRVAVGTVVVEDEVFHLFYNGATAEHLAQTAIGHATSPDGIHWTRDTANPILTQEMVAAENPPSSLNALTVVKFEDIWIMYYFAYAIPGNLASVEIRRATAPSLDGLWTPEADPINFAPGDNHQWDANIDSININVIEDGFAMYYDGCCNAGHNFGMATSADGINWIKYDDPTTTERVFAASDPIYFSQSQQWDHYIAAVNVVPIESGWAMIYQGVPLDATVFGIGYSTSPDGLTWTDYPNNPLFEGPLLTTSPYDRLRASVIVNDTLMIFFDPVWDSKIERGLSGNMDIAHRLMR